MLQKILALLVRIINFKNSGLGIASNLGKDSPFIYKLKLKLAALMEKRKKFMFSIFVAFTILLAFTNAALFYYYSKKMLVDAIDSGQAALVNVETDAVIVGNVIRDQEQKDEQKRLYEEAQAKHLEDNKEDEQNAVETQQFIAPELTEEDLNKSKVVIIVKDLGLSKSMTLGALELNSSFTLGFSPYAQDVTDWIEQATGKGFEVTLNLPMQPADYPVNDPGPYAMLHNLSSGENLSRLDWILSRSPKIIGVYTSENETFTNSRAGISPVLEGLQKRNKVLVYGNLTNEQTIKSLSESINLNFIPASINLDAALDEAKIKNNLLKLEGAAMTQGKAVGYISAYPLSISAVNKWLDEIDKSKLILVPISKLFSITPQSEESIREYEKERLLKGIKEVPAKQGAEASGGHGEPDPHSAPEGH